MGMISHKTDIIISRTLPIISAACRAAFQSALKTGATCHTALITMNLWLAEQPHMCTFSYKLMPCKPLEYKVGAFRGGWVAALQTTNSQLTGQPGIWHQLPFHLSP